MKNDYNYYYCIKLELTHPIINPEQITQALGLEPNHQGCKGDNVVEVNYYWTYSRYTEGERIFSIEVENVLDWLIENKKIFIDNFISTQGNFRIIVELPGKVNIGCTFSKTLFKKTLDLDIMIGIAVLSSLKNSYQ